MSVVPFTDQRPTIVAMAVGNRIGVTSSGASPSQPGDTRRNDPSAVPVARCPTYAKLFVQASTNCRT
jgi:hypothetical protein